MVLLLVGAVGEEGTIRHLRYTRGTRTSGCCCLISSAINGSTGILAICSASRFRSARFSSELLFSSNKFGIAPSELEDSNTR